MKLKARGRYTVIDPDQMREMTKSKNDFGEYTEGFYSSETDEFVPNENSEPEAQFVEDNQAALEITESLFASTSKVGVTNPERQARLAVAKA